MRWMGYVRIYGDRDFTVDRTTIRGHSVGGGYLLWVYIWILFCISLALRRRPARDSPSTVVHKKANPMGHSSLGFEEHKLYDGCRPVGSPSGPCNKLRPHAVAW